MSLRDAQRRIPPVHRFFSDPRIAAYETLLGHENVKSVVAAVLDRARGDGAIPDYDALSTVVLSDLSQEAAETLRPLINATGVLLHTNLGRAPISQTAWEAATESTTGYSNLEYDLAEGRRGSRYSRVSALLVELTGAQDAIVVNNCAAAVVLILDTFARAREVVIARNELIEIGGEFRLPDVFARSGAILVEVGAANKVYLRDFERALNANTALLFRSHLSNFRLSGFTERVSSADLAAFGARVGLPVVEDLGSGALIDFKRFGLPHERTVPEAVRDGVDLVAFSGDKLLAGPQAGIIVGKNAHIARLRENPLLRALRVDKVTIAVLQETLALYRSEDTLRKIPLFAMLSASLEDLHSRARRYVASLPFIEAVSAQSYVGGGTFPEASVPSVAIAVPDPAGNLHADLRGRTPPIVARLDAGRALLDLRTIAPHDDETVIEALKAQT
ncbi:MAG: L-seryl-tRNA(Sec) selenium transferase [Candidatus Eremiobacteraeota bacterium]|nr:L-seryl-tRNA(Sec) selenium transferase [Candidatus Eremiobacteraeota bacterium]